METTNEQLNLPSAASSHSRPTHRDLIEVACMYMARQEQRADPDLSLPRALAQGRRKLAAACRLKEHAIRRMREVNRVAAYHWDNFERATNGHVKAADFERAVSGKQNGRAGDEAPES